MRWTIDMLAKGLQRGALIGITLLIPACGPDRQVGQGTKKDADGTAADIPCTKTSCPKVVLNIAANPIQNGRLIGSVIGNEIWTITGSATGGTSRDIRMNAHNPPVGGEFVGQGSLNIQAKYTTTEPVESQAPIEVIIRDVSRCKYEHPGNDAVCENLDQPGAEEYEAKASLPWSIVTGDINQISDPSFTQIQAVPQGAHAGATGCVQGFVPGMLQGIIGGSLFGGILKGTVGCIGTSMSQLGR